MTKKIKIYIFESLSSSVQCELASSSQILKIIFDTEKLIIIFM